MTIQKDDTYKIRPAGRHILTIGRDLIQDQYAAIVELVKNAYDADSPDVNVTFKVLDGRKRLTITIEDHGHGMSRDVVVNNWLVPSTDDKLKRKKSPKGRRMQGRKGVGRYAASILGYDLLLETIDTNGSKTEVYVEWDQFKQSEYLDQVEVLVDTKKVKQQSGTTLTINASKEQLLEWDNEQLRKLEFELKKLISPISTKIRSSDDFEVYLNFEQFFKEDERNLLTKVEPFPVFDLYDYRISGTIKSNGKGMLIYDLQKAKNTVSVNIPVHLNQKTNCGEIDIDIRVYDRDALSVEQLIKRGLKDEKGNYVGKREARQLLNDYNGIGVYRNNFRIRPLGDPEYDWLALNKRRVQNPSLCIGSDQAIGYIQIESEEKSGLEEKSARDGLRENRPYVRLKEIVLNNVLKELEERRFQYRSKAGLSRHAVKIEKELEKLFMFEDVKKGIHSKLTKGGVDKKTTDEILSILSRKEEDNNRIVEDIRQTVAIYQGQATLGKIINVILHEGRKPLNFFKNQIPDIDFWSKKFYETRDSKILGKIIPIANNIGYNADIFVNLFNKLDPLAATKRKRKEEFNLSDYIASSFHIFEKELKKKKIKYETNCQSDFHMLGWSQDIYIILTNLIDNSIYWISEKRTEERSIKIEVFLTDDKLDYIDYKDTGPGIESHLIESGVIFEPEFSTKPGGTGLGLAIAGEAASRNGLELKAYDSENGVYFRLQPN